MIKKKIISRNEGYTLYEYIFNTENEQHSYPYSEEEELIKFATGVDKKYYTIVKKWDNFISSIRALTKENESKPFTQKHEYLTRKIREAAQKGYHSCSFMLDDNEIEDLIAEGFIVQRGVDCPSQISW